MNIYDISKEAKVSIATVSRVLNNRENVNEATRQRVLEVVKRYDYKPNAFARGLISNTMKMVGVLSGNFSDTNWANGLNFLEQKLRRNNYSSLVCCSGYSLREIERCVQFFLDKKVDAIILGGSYFLQENDADNEYLRRAAGELPIMLINASYDHPNVYSFVSNDYQAVFDVTTELYRGGAQNVLYTAVFDCYCSEQKRRGFRDATRLQGRDPEKLFLKVEHDTQDPQRIEITADAFAEAEAAGRSFDAVIAEEDLLGVAAVKYARRRGLRVPEDLQIVGYDDTSFALCSEPEMTSIDNRLKELCASSVDTIIRRLNAPDTLPPSASSRLDYRIVERSTTKPGLAQALRMRACAADAK